MNTLPRPRPAPGERMILHADGDPWNGCVVRITAHHTRQLVRCRLPRNQHRHAKARKAATRVLSTSDLF